jgi:hypothetical protein
MKIIGNWRLAIGKIFNRKKSITGVPKMKNPPPPPLPHGGLKNIVLFVDERDFEPLSKMQIERLKEAYDQAGTTNSKP